MRAESLVSTDIALPADLELVAKVDGRAVHREKKDEQAMALDLHSTILARSPIRLTFRLGEKQLVPLEVAISLGDKRSELGEHSGPC